MEADGVPTLPGFDGPLPTRWASGYVQVQGNNWHYIFQEAEVPDAPLLLFHPGGPGGSSVSMLFRFGQLQLAADEAEPEALPRLELNPHRWTRFVNIVAFDAPPPVGFGFCPDPADSVWDDDKVTLHSADFLEGFAARHPKLQGSELYVFGGSYGGILAPMLATECLRRAASASFPFRVVAVGAGNGAVGHFSGWNPPVEGWDEVNTQKLSTHDLPNDGQAHFDMMGRHGMMSEATYLRVLAECDDLNFPDERAKE